MEISNRVENIIIQMGLSNNNLEKLRDNTIKLIKNNNLMISYMQIINLLAQDIYSYLYNKNNYINGIVSNIYIPKLNNAGEINIKFFGNNEKIDRINTTSLFNSYCIIDLYSIILLFKLNEKSIINLNDIAISNYTFYDLINNKIDCLLENKEKKELIYNFKDIIQKKLNKNFEYLINEYLIKPLGLYKTVFNENGEMFINLDEITKIIKVLCDLNNTSTNNYFLESVSKGFSFQDYGSLINYDANNKIYHSVLVNLNNNETNLELFNFQMIKSINLIYILRQYYSIYNGVKQGLKVNVDINKIKKK